MINLEQLITIAPFPDDTRQELVEKLPTISEDQKYELTQLAWSLISQEYQTKLQFQMQNAMTEMVEGKKTYTQADFRQMEKDAFNELVKKLDAAEDKEKIDEVRQQLGLPQKDTTTTHN